MQDFSQTKIELLSREHSEAFQKEVLKAGGHWESGYTSPNHLLAKFLFIDSTLEITYEYSDRDHFSTSPYKEIFFPEPEQVKGHEHAELMALYAEDAKTHIEPWKLWQVLIQSGVWVDCDYHPCWQPVVEYRQKPKTRIIHGISIPNFEFTPKVGETYYTVNVGLLEFFGHGCRESERCTITQRMIERGLLYPCTEEGKNAAILHTKILLGKYDES